MTQETDFLRLARQLGVRVESPYFVSYEGALVRFDAYLWDFGGPNGMVIVLDGDCRNSRVADAAGFYFSALNGSAETSEANVKATFDDWGYYGDESKRPAWYSGKPWS